TGLLDECLVKLPMFFWLFDTAIVINQKSNGKISYKEFRVNLAWNLVN
ncbi:6893_t:CDS:1, partial [Entrophospora sp. SA101]